MLTNSEIFMEDLREIEAADIPWERFRDKRVLVTGGTGLIGMTMIFALLHVNEKRSLGMELFAVVRDTAKAERIFGPSA